MGAPSVINIGLAGFVAAPAAHGAQVLHVDWRPPAGGARELGLLLARMEDDADDPIGARVAAGNTTAMQRLLGARPMLIDVLPAREVIPSLGGAEKRLLHAGPPIAWQRMCGPMRGAIVGAILFEGWAADAEGAQALAESRGVQFQACHETGAVDTLGPALSASGPVDPKLLTGQALQMGDECRNRNVAATSSFARLIAPALVRSVDRDTATAARRQ